MKKIPMLQVYRDNSKEWRWRVRAANSKIVCDSAEGYKTRRGCMQAVDSLYSILNNADIVVMADSENPLKRWSAFATAERGSGLGNPLQFPGSIK